MTETVKRPRERHRRHCQCAWHRQQQPHRRKYPKWGWVFVTDPKTGRSVKTHPKKWMRRMTGRATLARLRVEGQQNVFTTETARKVAQKRWRHVWVNPKTGKKFVPLATKAKTARKMQRRRDK